MNFKHIIILLLIGVLMLWSGEEQFKTSDYMSKLHNRYNDEKRTLFVNSFVVNDEHLGQEASAQKITVNNLDAGKITAKDVSAFSFADNIVEETPAIRKGVIKAAGQKRINNIRFQNFESGKKQSKHTIFLSDENKKYQNIKNIKCPPGSFAFGIRVKELDAKLMDTLKNDGVASVALRCRSFS